MKLGLKNKKVLVTGSSKGIGKYIAKEFIKEGSKVIINSRNIDNLRATYREIGCFNYVVGDLSKPKQSLLVIEKTINLLGSLDILICNVGDGSSVKPGNENFEEWQKSIDANFFSAVNIIQDSINHLEKSRGSIVCITSICGQEIITDAPLTYSCAKAALNFYIKGISRPLGEKNIRINGISPGNILFEGSTWEKKLIKNHDKVKSYIKNNVPLNSFGKPEDIAKLACYLSSDFSKFATGSIWNLDGGQIRN